MSFFNNRWRNFVIKTTQIIIQVDLTFKAFSMQIIVFLGKAFFLTKYFSYYKKI